MKKTYGDDKINLTEKVKFVLGRIENIVGKGENAGLPAFSLFPTTFSKVFFIRVVRIGCGKELTHYLVVKF